MIYNMPENLTVLFVQIDAYSHVFVFLGFCDIPPSFYLPWGQPYNWRIQRVTFFIDLLQYVIASVDSDKIVQDVEEVCY